MNRGPPAEGTFARSFGAQRACRIHSIYKWLSSGTFQRTIRGCKKRGQHNASLPGTGGTSIEDLAEKFPDKIIKIPADIFEGITDEQANKMVEGLKIQGDKKAAAEQIKALYKCFTDSDCTMVEVCSPYTCIWTSI